jgi:glycine betaine/proline transport system ATP-binding protein
MRLQGVLKKTIAFVTHDFDEAIRLADRVAIMKDGEVIQVGTPEDLVINPATSYVAEFTRDVNRSKVMSARRLMRRALGGEHGGRIDANAKIASFASQIVTARLPFAVVDHRGALIGEVTPQSVIDLLAGHDGGGARP